MYLSRINLGGGVIKLLMLDLVSNALIQNANTFLYSGLVKCRSLYCMGWREWLT